MWTIARMRPANDLDAIVALEAATFTNPWTREMIAWELDHSDVSHFIVVRTADDGVIAYCSFWLLFDELHLNNLAVQLAWRRRGVATALMTEMLREAAMLGARRATLEVRPSNTPALRLYEQLGFTVAATRPDYYTDPREHALILWHDCVDEFDRTSA